MTLIVEAGVAREAVREVVREVVLTREIAPGQGLLKDVDDVRLKELRSPIS